MNNNMSQNDKVEQNLNTKIIFPHQFYRKLLMLSKRSERKYHELIKSDFYRIIQFSFINQINNVLCFS